MKARDALLACALAGCGGPSLRGAIAVQAGTEPRPEGTPTVLVPSECRDRAGAPAHVASEFWLGQSDAREVLVESRQGHASIVVTNRVDLPSGVTESAAHDVTVFQFVSDDGDGPPLLHDIRFERNERRRAALTVTDRFEERSIAGRRLAIPGPALVSCRLDTREGVE